MVESESVGVGGEYGVWVIGLVFLGIKGNGPWNRKRITPETWSFWARTN